MAADKPFDLVLADELMPGKGGLDLLAVSRSNSIPRDCRSSSCRCSVRSRRRRRVAASARRHRIEADPCLQAGDASREGAVGRIAPGRQHCRGTHPATFRGHRVLLVEDNPVNQRVAQRLLQKLGRM